MSETGLGSRLGTTLLGRINVRLRVTNFGWKKKFHRTTITKSRNALRQVSARPLLVCAAETAKPFVCEANEQNNGRSETRDPEPEHELIVKRKLADGQVAG